MTVIVGAVKKTEAPKKRNSRKNTEETKEEK